MDHPPPCCASCPELASSRTCRLLAEPRYDNRIRLFTMPCDIRRLVRQRLRAHGDDIAEQALTRWESEDLGPERFVVSGGRPMDARLWATPWPFEVLARESLERVAPPSLPPPSGDALPAHDARIFAALFALFKVDPAGFGIVLEGARGSLDTVTWRIGLGDTDSVIAERIALALFRFLVLRSDVLVQVGDARARACLAAKRFRGGDPSEFAALSAARAELAEPGLTVVALRELDQRGAVAALQALEADPEINVLCAAGALTAFRRALRLDSEAEIDTAYEAPLFALIARDLRQAVPRAEDGHASPDDLAGFVAAELSSSRSAAIIEHLSVCRDQRCNRLVRGEICGLHAVRRALSGPMSDAPPAFTSGPMPSAATPRMIRCRDVLWDTFTSMARAEGREVDDLVDEAMDRYRALRSHVGAAPAPAEPEAEPPTTRRSSIPPSMPKSGLRFDQQRQAFSEPHQLDEPTAKRAALAEAPDASDEPTQPTKRR